MLTPVTNRKRDFGILGSIINCFHPLSTDLKKLHVRVSISKLTSNLNKDTFPSERSMVMVLSQSFSYQLPEILFK